MTSLSILLVCTQTHRAPVELERFAYALFTYALMPLSSQLPPAKSASAAPSLAGRGIHVPRVLGRLHGAPGPTLVAVGGVHGNEPAGVLALARVFARLAGHNGPGVTGRFIGLAGNIKGIARRQRFLGEDLNRIWLPERIARVRSASGPLDDEEEELAALDREFTRAQQEASGPLVVFDVHCFSGPGNAFVTLDDTLSNRALAFRIPAPCVLGLEEELRGTLTEHFVSAGITSFGFESGQLDDPRSVDRAEAAVWIVLEATGILTGSWSEIARSRRLLADESRSLPSVVEVRHRHAITSLDEFRMLPGYVGFQPVRAGEPLASSLGGDVIAPLDGLILMPLYQGQGNDGFFIVRPVRRFWLWLSASLRRVPVRGILGWLPGVSRHPSEAGSYLVDTRKARWLALQIFHLLGFKRRGRLPHGLVMSPRGR